MTTNNRISRFDNDKISVINLSGSIKNNYLFENGTLRSNVDSTDPNESLASFPSGFYKFTNQKIYELFNSEFTEFVGETPEVADSADIFTQEQSALLQARLNELTNQLDNISEFVSLSATQKKLIIELRILLGEGNTESDFSPEYPYNPWTEDIRQQTSLTNSKKHDNRSGDISDISRESEVTARSKHESSVAASPNSQQMDDSLILGGAPLKFVSSTIGRLGNTTSTINDIQESPDILAENMLIINNDNVVLEKPIKYDNNNNIITEEDLVVPSNTSVIGDFPKDSIIIRN